ncbi:MULTISPECIES: GNAT family N-acetyltransferase [Thermus]|jgi:RimJ/RimL family protein N-acetyltransferase|uniref:N-acetyltransferase n=4 Tax=Thermus TaxID=270 RepID=A0A430RI06_THESC|nr:MULTISPECIES: GNAT family protein [Thermus]QWK23066.1 MAG: GNAT family N-acetyltransferase [Thermus antranikianii]GBD40309.1 Acetyltransferase [bacterium HR38]RTG98439.1 N-acetyltransferase [Thermus scotoductus]RTH08061.1 N-acetyltransferase [Thermus scotoductus]RTH28058.1 N-acetyltransferase [Thermus scotoductus]
MFVGEKVRLDPIQRAHLPKIIAWMYKEEVIARAFFGDPLPKSLEEMEAWLQQLRANPNARVLAVIHRETEEIVGEVALQPIDWRNRSAFFAIILGEESRRGEGLGTEASRLVLRYAFEGLNLNRVEANVLSSNEASTRLLKRVGFTWEGRRRDAVWRFGRWEDMEIYGITARDWQEGKGMGEA